MNVAHAYLERRWGCAALTARGVPRRLTWVALTPRFRASAHVVFLGLAPDTGRLVLVAKVARLPDHGQSLVREAANLRAVQEARSEGFDSIPRLLEIDAVDGCALLVETGLPGRVLSAERVRRRLHVWASALASWITTLHASTAHWPFDANDTAGGGGADRLAEESLARLEHWLPDEMISHETLQRARALVHPLRDQAMPLVMTHGDLGAPNILVSAGDALGVVDWELAEPQGMPAQDLFFGLAFLAFAQARAVTIEQHLASLHSAFFADDAWAVPFVRAYASQLELPHEALAPLYVACWSRYLATRIGRLVGNDDQGLDRNLLTWLEQDRFLAIWRHAICQADSLRLAR